MSMFKNDPAVFEKLTPKNLDGVIEALQHSPLRQQLQDMDSGAIFAFQKVDLNHTLYSQLVTTCPILNLNSPEHAKVFTAISKGRARSCYVVSFYISSGEVGSFLVGNVKEVEKATNQLRVYVAKNFGYDELVRVVKYKIRKPEEETRAFWDGIDIKKITAKDLQKMRDFGVLEVELKRKGILAL